MKGANLESELHSPVAEVLFFPKVYTLSAFFAIVGQWAIAN